MSGSIFDTALFRLIPQQGFVNQGTTGTINNPISTDGVSIVDNDGPAFQFAAFRGLDCGILPIQNLSEISFGFWIRITRQLVVARVLSIQHSGVDDIRAALTARTNVNQVAVDDGLTTAVFLGGAPPNDEWSLVGMSYDGSVMSAFVNGVKVGEATGSFNFATASGALGVGRAGGNNNGHSPEGMLLDGVTIWPSALDDQVFA